MCVVCGSLGGPVPWTEEPGETAAREYLIRRILSTKGLALRPWQGAGYIVVGYAGASELAPSLAALWAVVERASGGPADPLDPVFLDDLTHGAHPA